jgi:hypothetical protein
VFCLGFATNPLYRDGMMFRKSKLDEPLPTKRQRRAEAARRRALSPLRILLMVLCLPLTVALISFNMFVRLSDYGRDEAMVHLIALAGCDASRAIGFGTFYEGYAGYHPRNDPAGDGVACGPDVAQRQTAPSPSTTTPRETSASQRSLGNAKFIKP